jgi:mono/diheme cytochrome c family protein
VTVRAALALAALVVPAAVRAYTPDVEFALNCQGCHRADGGGTPGSVPAIAGHVARFLAVPGGREYLVQVPGVAQAPLDDATLAAVVNWMLDHYDRNHIPKDFTPYTESEVARLRKDPLVNVEAVRTKLLKTIEPKAP